jgi:hypothetical protein
MAHIKWRRPNTFTGSCAGFVSKSWSDPQNWPNMNDQQYRWTPLGKIFGQRDKNVKPHAVPDPTMADVTTLKNIYQSNVWTALGAASPEEDFVETYAIQAFLTAAQGFQIHVIIDPNGTPQEITVNDPNRNASDASIINELNDKLTCAKSLL